MPNPKRKHSRTRSAKRRATWKTELPEVTPNKHQSGEPFLKPHCATSDGYYKGRRLPGFKDKTQ